MHQTHYHLEVRNLTFTRSDQELFHDLNFSVANGSVLQVVGPNGVGKTTLLRIIAGLIAIEQGEIFWRGKNIQICAENYNSDLAYIGHHTGISQSLTPLENLQIASALHLTKPHSINHLLDKFNLIQQAMIPAAHLSAGQQRRIAYACLLLRSAKVWILDEPLAALDKDGTSLVEQLLCDHIKQNGLAIITTHQSLTLASLPVQRLELGNG